MRAGIRGKLLLVSVGLICVSVIAGDAYFNRALDRELTERTHEDLLVRLRLLERDVSASPAGPGDQVAWDRLADDLGRRAGARVTLIRADGVVLGDSDVATADLATLQNHAERPEVRDALTRGRGQSARWSSTVERRMMYVAERFVTAFGVTGVARLATPRTRVDDAIARMRRLVLVGSLLALFVAVVMSSLAAHFMSRSVRALTATARRMAEGDLAARTRVAGRDEIAQLGSALDGLAGSLQVALGQLRTERDLLGRVLDGMREGVLLLDVAGRLALANPSLREMLLLGPDVVGKELLAVVRNAALKQLLDDARATDQTVSRELELGDLKPRRLLVHALRLTGEPAGVLAVFVDVTDLRRLESLRRDFVANVSHELRTPVASIRGAAETLRGAAATDPEAAERFVDIIERNSERLHRLVEDLLDLSRIESRDYRLNLEAVDIREVAGPIVPLFRSRADERRMRLALEIPDAIGLLRADRRALEQVLSNLIDNAVKYASEGGTITVRAAREGSMIRISVEDTGPGIEEKYLARLFERFYRIDAGRSRELGGTGLGLSIVKHLVEAMGGVVGVQSAPGVGTAFSFVLRAE